MTKGLNVMPLKHLFSILLFSGISSSAIHAKNLGSYGQTFEIQEKNLLSVIEGRLKQLEGTGKIEDYQKDLQKKMAARVNRPMPVSGLIKATTYQSRVYDPTFVVSEDIKDHKGNLLAKKGDKINPLETHSFGAPLLFIEGDDEAQVKWALKQPGKIILISGAPLQLAKTHNRDFYFDQGGVLTEKFGITEIPARVSQQKNKLLVEMIPVREGAN